MLYIRKKDMTIFLFDIDGTLINTGGAGSAGMVAGLASAFGRPGSSDGISFHGRTDRAIGLDILRRHAIEPSEANWSRFRAAYLSHLPVTLKSHMGTVLPGVGELLGLLGERTPAALGLLTGNVREGARLKLEHYGLFHHFRFGGYGDEHLDRADVARAALAEARGHVGPVEPDRVWVIGDTPLDVQCAKAVGARSLAVATGGIPASTLAAAGADLVLGDLSDPAPVLALTND